MPKTSIRKSLSTIWKYLRPYKKQARVAFVLVLGEHALKLAAPLVFGKMIDSLTSSGSFTHAFYFLALWLGLDVVAASFMRLRVLRAAKISYWASADLITKSIEHLVRLPLSYHKDKKVGEVIQRISRASNYLDRLIEDGLFYVAPTLLSAILSFAFIAWINWVLGIIYLVFVLGHMLVTVRKTAPIIAYQKQINRINEKIYGNIFDRTPNVLEIKANNAEKAEHQTNLKGFAKGFGMMHKEYLLWTELGLWQKAIVSLGLLAFFGSGAHLVSTGKISIGAFVALLGYINMLNSYLYLLGFYYKSMQEGLVTIGRSETIFEQKTERYDDPAAAIPEDVRGGIEFEDVSFAYEKEAVLEKISFAAKPGQMVAIVGKSGEGKSTLLSLISRYNEPKRGKIFLDGTDLQKISLTHLRSLIAIVPQEVTLFNDTILANIRYSRPSASQLEVLEAAKMANCDEFIRKFPKKYKQLVGERGVKLSTGQKQRLAIARAILRDPKILILDEATSALDSESEKMVQEALEKVMRGRTTFVIAHRLSTIRKADLIIVLENGRIAEVGDHKELTEKGGVYKKLSELQNITV